MTLVATCNRRYWAGVFFFLGTCGGVAFAAENQNLNYLKAVDVPHPRCEDKVDLNAASEYFVELGNDVPGVEAYNAIVRLYQKQDWAGFEAKAKAFKKLYENSPLQEPLAYLYTQAKFDVAADGDMAEIKEAERYLRETLLLYPKSQLAPVLAATAASLWMKHSMYERALSMYETAKSQYPFDALVCVFHTGVAEANYLLHNTTATQTDYELVLQKCSNRRLRLTAQVRLAALRLEKDSMDAGKLYEKLYAENGSELSRFFPGTLANLGEIKYGQREYPRAKFYFKEYLKLAKTLPECASYVEKRMADIAFRNGETIEEVKGLYLVSESDHPDQDGGKFSKVMELLIDLKSANSAEYERRLKLVDEAIEGISNLSLKKAGFLAKGLVLLDAGEASAVDYLVRLHEREPFNLDKGPIAAFVKDRVFELLKETVQESDGSPSADKDAADPFVTLNTVYSQWLKNTPYAEKTQKLYAELATKAFTRAAQQGNTEQMLQVLKNWKASPLYHKNRVAEMENNQAASLVQLFHDSKNPQQLSAFLRENEPLIREFTGKSAQLIWAVVAMNLDDEKGLKSVLKTAMNIRQISSVDSDQANLKDYALLLLGEARLKAKQFAEAEQAFEQIEDPDLVAEKLDQELALYESQKLYSKAFYAAERKLEAAPDAQKPEALMKIADLVRKGKLWNRAPEALKMAEKAKLAGKDLAAFHFLAGKANFELGRYKVSANEYETALSLDSFSQDAAEGRFHLGKCFIKLKRPTEARRIWEDLTKMKDPFWSGLAQNEIKLINP